MNDGAIIADCIRIWTILFIHHSPWKRLCMCVIIHDEIRASRKSFLFRFSFLTLLAREVTPSNRALSRCRSTEIENARQLFHIGLSSSRKQISSSQRTDGYDRQSPQRHTLSKCYNKHKHILWIHWPERHKRELCTFGFVVHASSPTRIVSNAKTQWKWHKKRKILNGRHNAILSLNHSWTAAATMERVRPIN